MQYNEYIAFIYTVNEYNVNEYNVNNNAMDIISLVNSTGLNPESEEVSAVEEKVIQ